MDNKRLRRGGIHWTNSDQHVTSRHSYLCIAIAAYTVSSRSCPYRTKQRFILQCTTSVVFEGLQILP
eukprot:1813434-Amphidinium_carterae.1